jgi:uncharacterized protein
MQYLPRLIDPLLAELLDSVSAVMVIGPRASGKTTTARRLAATTLQLDRPEQAAVVRADPDGALRALARPVLIDEWQAAPEVLGAVKRIVDRDPEPGQFLLTGSASNELGPEGWPLTGRVVRLRLWGLSQRELHHRSDGSSIIDRLFTDDIATITAPPDPPDLRGYADLALHPTLPQIAVNSSARTRARLTEAYLDHLTTRDTEALGARRDPRRIRRYLAALAANTAGIPERKTVYDAADIDRRTALTYDTALESLFVTQQIHAWTTNRLGRLTQTTKRYLTDPSFITSLSGVDTRALMRNADLLGRAIDTFVVAQLRPELEVTNTRVTMHHLRQTNGRHEADLILEANDGRIVAIEFKAGSAPTLHDARHLTWLRDQLDDAFTAGIIFHTGARPFRLADRIHALPIATIWGPTS